MGLISHGHLLIANMYNFEGVKSYIQARSLSTICLIDWDQKALKRHFMVYTCGEGKASIIICRFDPMMHGQAIYQQTIVVDKMMLMRFQ